MKISFITTVYNEEKTIKRFLDSLFAQTQLPEEIIIVDGGSSDATVSTAKDYLKNKKIPWDIFIKKGNRSVGRNEAIHHSRGSIIVCSDAGNILDDKWIEKIVEPFTDSEVAVVAGYYKGLSKNAFQKSLIPYVLVMPDKVDPNTFLPATRSMAFRKSIWKKLGGFNEQYSHNEDYVFAKQLEKVKATIFFQKDAIAMWLPRETLQQAFIMFFRFAYGDAEAGIFRPKVIILYIRYIIMLSLFLVGLLISSKVILLSIAVLFSMYIVWAILKNYRYVRQWQAVLYLPLLQFCADAAVLSGTTAGTCKRFLKS